QHPIVGIIRVPDILIQRRSAVSVGSATDPDGIGLLRIIGHGRHFAIACQHKLLHQRLLATAATMSRVALPELRRYGYSGGFSTATLAAGGTLGILIPPSVILVIYAILTEQNIAKLFLAAFVPGILAAIGYIITISIYVRLNPKSAGTRERVPYSERITALMAVWPVVLLFSLVVGGIYLGWFTPTEGAAVGAAGTGLVALVSGNLTWKIFVDSIIATATSTAMIFFIVLGAGLYNSFLALSQVPQELSSFVV
ncbi:TRAP transporter large permease subunit, partial [Escherichia coli]|nr:TRAP transporter large permease subunit [Escherichia coli]